MASTCEVCGKGPMYGNNVSRLGRKAVTRRVKARTKRRWVPNIQPIRVWVNGSARRMYVCTSCIKGGRVQRPPTGGQVLDKGPLQPQR